MPKRKRHQKPKVKAASKQRSEPLRLTFYPAFRQLSISHKIRCFTPRCLCDLPAEILTQIFAELGTVDHVMLALCNKLLSRVSMSLSTPPPLPSRHSLDLDTYKSHMEILVRLSKSVPEDQNICWYCGLYLPWTDEWNIGRPIRVVKLWEDASANRLRAYFCPTCTKLKMKSWARVQQFFMLSWIKGNVRENKFWSEKIDRIVNPPMA